MKTTVLYFFLLIIFINSYSQCGMDIVFDYDGNLYQTVPIGNQCWLKENMRTTHYADGDSIMKVEGETEWNNLSVADKAYCWYNDDSATNAEKYGKLYTWAAAVNGNDSSDSSSVGVQGICPDGWHLPSSCEWEQLAIYISKDNGGYVKFNEEWYDVGKHLKATSGWVMGNG